MHQNIPVAIGLAVVGSFCFALAAKVQHGAVRGEVDENPGQHPLTLRELWRVLHKRAWWAGIGLMTVSLICLLLGLSMAPVSVYQPIQLLAFPWSVALGYATLGDRARRVLVPTAVTVVATAVFVLIVSLHAVDSTDRLAGVPLLIGAGVIYVIALLFWQIASHGPLSWRCLFWSSGGALFYGLEAALIRALMQYATVHVWWQSPLVWVILPALIIGSQLAGLYGQHGYATGSPEVVVASMTVTSPVVAVAFGVAVLGEGRGLPGWTVPCLVVLGAIAIGGVATLARIMGSHRRILGAESAGLAAAT